MRTLRLSLAGTVLLALLGGLGGAVIAQSLEPEQDVEWPQLTRGIVYGEDDSFRQVIHVFEPEPRAEPRPAVVFFHGGGLVFGVPLQDMDWAQAIAEQGYVTYMAGYRLFDENTGENPWPAQLDDAQRAIQWVRAHADEFNVDPGRICAIGHSSGGHLAGLVGTTEASGLRTRSWPVCRAASTASYRSRATSTSWFRPTIRSGPRWSATRSSAGRSRRYRRCGRLPRRPTTSTRTRCPSSSSMGTVTRTSPSRRPGTSRRLSPRLARSTSTRRSQPITSTCSSSRRSAASRKRSSPTNVGLPRRTPDRAQPRADALVQDEVVPGALDVEEHDIGVAIQVGETRHARA